MPERIELTPSQRTRCNRLIRRLCANYDNGNCLPLDEGDGCVCVQMISLSLICKYFRNAVLPADKELYAEIFRQRTYHCAECKADLKKYFPAGYTNEQMRRDIIKGLELLKRQRERNRDAR